jgi:hypothetical protein
LFDHALFFLGYVNGGPGNGSGTRGGTERMKSMGGGGGAMMEGMGNGIVTGGRGLIRSMEPKEGKAIGGKVIGGKVKGGVDGPGPGL